MRGGRERSGRGDGLSRSSQQRQDRSDEDANRHRAQTEVVERDATGQTGRRGLRCVHGDLSKDEGRRIRNGGPSHQNQHRPAPTSTDQHRPAPTSTDQHEPRRKTRDSFPSDLGPERTDGIDASSDRFTPQPAARAVGNGGVPFGLKGRNALAVPIAPDGTKNPKRAVFRLEIDSQPDGGRTVSPECDSPKE